SAGRSRLATASVSGGAVAEAFISLTRLTISVSTRPVWACIPHAGYGSLMPRNPLDDVARGLRIIGERITQTTGAEPAEWLDQLDVFRRQEPEPERSIEELQAELDALVGLGRV